MSPWVPTLTELFPKIQADAGSWLGTKSALYYCDQSANSSPWVLSVKSYTTAIVLPHFPDESKKCLGYYQQEQFNFPREYSVFDSSQCIVNNSKLKMRRRRESQINNSLTRQNNNFAHTSHFLYISWRSTARLPVKIPNFMFCEGRKQAMTKSIFFMNSVGYGW